jgi:hypothetical protein
MKALFFIFITALIYSCRVYSDHISISENITNDLILGKSNPYEGVWYLKRLDTTYTNNVFGIGVLYFPNPEEIYKCDSILLFKNKSLNAFAIINNSDSLNYLTRYKNLDKFNLVKSNLKLDEKYCIKIYNK